MFSTHAYKQIQGDDFRFKRILTDESYQLTAVNLQTFRSPTIRWGSTERLKTLYESSKMTNVIVRYLELSVLFVLKNSKKTGHQWISILAIYAFWNRIGQSTEWSQLSGVVAVLFPLVLSKIGTSTLLRTPYLAFCKRFTGGIAAKFAASRDRKIRSKQILRPQQSSKMLKTKIISKEYNSKGYPKQPNSRWRLFSDDGKLLCTFFV